MPFIEEKYIYMLVIMFVAGIFGGIVNFFLMEEAAPSDDDDPPVSGDAKRPFRYKLVKALFIGLAGSFLVPLFLSLITVGLSGGKTGADELLPGNYLVFAGVCLIAAIYARRFMQTVSDRVFKLAKEAKQEAKQANKNAGEAKKEAETAKEKANESKSRLSDVTDTVNTLERDILLSDVGKPEALESMGKGKGGSGKQGGGIFKSFVPADVEEGMPKKGRRVKGDPQKNQWGGKPERNDRRLSAKVTEGDLYYNSYEIVLEVASTKPGEKPLIGSIIFYLHDSFKKDVRIREARDGKAVLKLYAFGAFTVGAVCDEGKTLLELDLSELPDAPREFKES